TSGPAARSRPADDDASDGEDRSVARGESAIARLRPSASHHFTGLSVPRRRGQQLNAPAFHGFNPLASPGVTSRLLHHPAYGAGVFWRSAGLDVWSRACGPPLQAEHSPGLRLASASRRLGRVLFGGCPRYGETNWHKASHAPLLR